MMCSNPACGEEILPGQLYLRVERRHIICPDQRVGTVRTLLRQARHRLAVAERESAPLLYEGDQA
ncbi:MAG TPA: hypothetical protein VK595_11170 [Vicinamibacterales bacterium]|nr:hypothetical protein [Vicinamibacterales bacterium]